MALSQSGACSRLSVLGLRQSQVHGILNDVNRWTRSSGPEWTVTRLKALKVMFIQHLAGNTVFRSPWISCDGLGRPKGHFKCLWECLISGKPVPALSAESDDPLLSPCERERENEVRSRRYSRSFQKWERKVYRSLNALMIYSSQVALTVTPKQWSKFSISVENPSLSAEGDPLLKLPRRVTRRKRVIPESKTYPDLGRLILSPRKRVPVTLNERTVSVPETEIENWFHAHWHQPWLWKIAGQYPETGLNGWLMHLVQCRSDRTNPPKGLTETVGKVSFIQEPGWKLRAVANPNRILQLFLEPLKEEVWDLLRNISQDCTHNQDKGVSQVQSWLKEGRVVHSVDLSDATNNFPLDLQIMILQNVLDASWEPYLKVFTEASRGPWRVKDPGTRIERDIRWRKGQPLGLGPSFGSFALAHHAIIRPITTNYVVLGDDVCICGDAELASYKGVLKLLGCPISEEKTISSSKLAEFAGKVITPTAVLPPYKWRDVSDRSFLDVARNLGPGAVKLLKPRQRAVVEAFAAVPDYLGGLGWNPKGLTEAERRLLYPEAFLALETERANDVPAASVARRRFEYALRLGFVSGKKSALQALTQDVESRLRDTDQVSGEGSVATWQRVVRSTTQTKLVVPEDFPLSGFVPNSKESDPRGPTTLELLEKKLGIGVPSRFRFGSR